MLATLAVTACSALPGSESAPAPARTSEADAHLLGHVHGLGVDPASDTLYVASHFGVFRVEPGKEPERIADRWQDTMAFTVIGPGHFLASGHPDLREDLPVHLGLIESTDAAESWRSLSLQGEADFHALATSGGRLYGYDAAHRTLLTTTDRATWHQIDAHVSIADLAVDPGDNSQVLASTPRGRILHYDLDGERPSAVPGPPLVLLDWPRHDLLVGVTSDGRLFTSRDAGKRWQRTGQTPGPPTAFDATADVWHVATETGLFRSADSGRSWISLRP